MNKVLLKNYFFNILIVFTNVVFPLLLFPYASRVLSPEQYGKYNYAISIASYFVSIANLGVQSYGLRELAKVRNCVESLKKKFSEVFFITFLASMVSTIVYVVLILTIKELRQEIVLFVIVGLTVVTAFMNLDYLFVALENHKRRTMRLLITRALSLIFLFYLVKSEKDYKIFALIMVLPEILVKTVDIYSIRKYLKLQISKLQLREHIKPLLIIFFYILSQTVYMNIDSTMLGSMKGNESVGYYSVASKMARIVLPLVSSLGIVLSPRIIESIKNGDKNRIYQDMDLCLNFIFFVTIPATLLIGILSDNMIIMFSGEKYMSAILPMRVMLPIIFFISISGFASGQVLIPTDNEKKVLNVAIVGVVLNFVLNFALIPKYSILGAAVATLFAEFIVYVLRAREMKKIFSDYTLFSKERCSYIISGTISFIIVVALKYTMFPESDFYNFIILSAIYGVIYLSILFYKKEYFLMTAADMLKKFK